MSPSPGRGRLYLVPNTLDLGTVAEGEAPTPLTDVLPQGVLDVAAGLAYWVAENAKSARLFLRRLHQTVPLHRALQEIEVRELPRPQKGRASNGETFDWKALLAPALQGHDVGLISEAGLPGVADPGAELVKAAHGVGVRIVALPGPSSLILALAASGLNGQSFAFVGYLPTDPHDRVQRIKELEAASRKLRQTQMLIETPYRNEAMLAALLGALAPQTWLSVSTGLTLDFAQTHTAQVCDWRRQPMQMPSRVPAVFCLMA